MRHKPVTKKAIHKENPKPKIKWFYPTKFYQTCKEELTSILFFFNINSLQIFPKKGGTLSNTFYETNISLIIRTRQRCQKKTKLQTLLCIGM